MSPRVGRGLGVATASNAVRPPRSETTLSSERFPEDGGFFETEFEEERTRVDRPRFSCPRPAHLPIVLRARAGRQFQGRLPVAAERTGLFLFRAVTFINDEKESRHGMWFSPSGGPRECVTESASLLGRRGRARSKLRNALNTEAILGKTQKPKTSMPPQHA